MLALACTAQSSPRPGPGESELSAAARLQPAAAIVAAAERLSRQELWPGFDPRRVPVAIYDGERTLLFRHPDPPARFQHISKQSHVLFVPGRHPAVVANSTTNLGGVLTATLLLTSDSVRSVRSWAGILVHEMFHVFQRENHPDWTANAAHLFTYPVVDVELLMLRRLETEALRRALELEVRTRDESACWARAALRIRRDRFSSMPANAVAYERGSELKEGLAHYIQHRALDNAPAGVIPEDGFDPDAVRDRTYATGEALAILLDRFSRGWRSSLENGETRSLDEMLIDAIGAENGPGCRLSALRAGAQAAAIRGIAELQSDRAERLAWFMAREGWRITIQTDEAPLFAKRFDPANVEILVAGTVLHTRFLELGNATGSVQIMGRMVLTDGAGEHPLFNGIRSTVITGLAAEPEVSRDGTGVVVTADGITIKFSEAEIERINSVHSIIIRPTGSGGV